MDISGYQRGRQTCSKIWQISMIHKHSWTRVLMTLVVRLFVQSTNEHIASARFWPHLEIQPWWKNKFKTQNLTYLQTAFGSSFPGDLGPLKCRCLHSICAVQQKPRNLSQVSIWFHEIFIAQVGWVQLMEISGVKITSLQLALNWGSVNLKMVLYARKTRLWKAVSVWKVQSKVQFNCVNLHCLESITWVQLAQKN